VQGSQSLSIHLCTDVTCVDVIGPPHLVSSRYVRRHLVAPGDRLRLPCPVRANPPALVTWYKDGGTIHLGWDRYRVRADDWTLTVRDVQLDDTGIFTCRATNGFGSIDITYLVYVSRKSLRDNNGILLPMTFVNYRLLVIVIFLVWTTCNKFPWLLDSFTLHVKYFCSYVTLQKNICLIF